MSLKESSTANQLLSLAGIAGVILVFAVVLYVAYLPGRPPAIDRQQGEARRQAADEAHAAGLAKIIGFEVIDTEAGTVRIPIETAMDLTVKAYRVSEK